MPTYEYRCDSCGHEFETFQKITDDPLTACPRCTGTVERLITVGGGFMVKGQGVHATDYAGEKPSPRCGRGSTCCGREIPCATRPCDT